MRRKGFALAMALVQMLGHGGVIAAVLPAPATLSPHLGGFQYLSPIPGSGLNSPAHTIVIRPGGRLDPGTIEPLALEVSGSVSGPHPGRLAVARDGLTIVFTPDRSFTPGETVHVRSAPGLGAVGGVGLPALDYTFTIASETPPRRPMLEWEWPARTVAPGLVAPATLRNDLPREPGGGLPPPQCSLPPGYPVTQVLVANDPEPGDIFLAPFYGAIADAHLLILDDLGMPMFYRMFPGGDGTFDFKRQPNGLLTYILGATDQFYAMDSTYAVVDSFAVGNGYATDLHELQLLPFGDALLLSYDREIVDMSAIVPGGNPRAVVIGLILQELDPARNVIFQWRSWDHFALTDLASPDIALTDSIIDWVHGNAIEFDADDNLLLSSRHLNEITKIDRKSGDIIWRMGLNAVNNQFAFPNDRRGFSHQHDIRRLPNGHVTLFDNGNFLDPVYSRAVEYNLDEVNKVATLVWEYRNIPDTYGGFMGDVQRHASGGSLVGWGGTYASPNLTELHANGSKALEIAFDDSEQVWWSYRAFRFPWRTTRFTFDQDSLDFGVIGPGDIATLPIQLRNTTAEPVTISCAVITDSCFTLVTGLPATLAPAQPATFRVAFSPTEPSTHRAMLYLRQTTDNEVVAQSVPLIGIGSGAGAVGGATPPEFGLSGSRPNPFARATTIEYALPRAERVRLEILDVRGRLIETLVDGPRPAGRHAATWSARGAPSGIYFCRLAAGGRTATFKLALMR